MATEPKKKPKEKLADWLRVNDTITSPAPLVGSAFGPIGTAVGTAIGVIGNMGGNLADQIDPDGATVPTGSAGAGATAGGSPVPVAMPGGVDFGSASVAVSSGGPSYNGKVKPTAAPAPPPKASPAAGLIALVLAALAAKVLM